MQRKQIYNLVLTSFFIAVGIVLSMFSQMIYFGGGAGMRIGFSSYITVLPSFLFGPVYGGAAMGITDILAYLIKPDGAYLFPLTVTAVLGGVLRGVLWRFFKNKTLPFLPSLTIFILLIVVGVANYILSGTCCAYGEFLLSFGKKLSLVTVLPIVFGTVSAILVAANAALQKTLFSSKYYINVLATLMTANIAVTTANTVLLMLLIPSLSKLAFLYFYLPRLAEEIANTSMQSYVVSYLLKLSECLRQHS